MPTTPKTDASKFRWSQTAQELGLDDQLKDAVVSQSRKKEQIEDRLETSPIKLNEVWRIGAQLALNHLRCKSINADRIAFDLSSAARLPVSGLKLLAESPLQTIPDAAEAESLLNTLRGTSETLISNILKLSGPEARLSEKELARTFDAEHISQCQALLPYLVESDRRFGSNLSLTLLRDLEVRRFPNEYTSGSQGIDQLRASLSQ